MLIRFREHNRATSRICKALLHCFTVIETKVITVNLFFIFFGSAVGHVDFPGGSVVKNLPDYTGNTKDLGLIPGSGRSPGERNGNPLHYSCLGNSMDNGAWWATVHGVTKSWT